MSRCFRRVLILVVAALAVLGPGGGPASARDGAGFGVPSTLSPAGRIAGGAVPSIGGRGHTLVTWQEVDRNSRTVRSSWWARVGRRPEGLGSRVRLAGSGSETSVRAAVGADGSGLVCWIDRQHALRCATASWSRQRLIGTRTLRRWRSKQKPRIAALTIDGSGRAVMLVRTRTNGLEDELQVSAGPHAKLSAPNDLTAVPTSAGAMLTVGPANTVIGAWSVFRDPRRPSAGLRAQIATMPAGALTFSAAQDPNVEEGASLDPAVYATSTGALVTYRPYLFEASRAGAAIARPFDPNAGFGAAAPVLDGAKGRAVADVAVGGSGETLAVSREVRFDDSDCGGPVSGQLFVGAVGSAQSQRVTPRNQIVLGGQAAFLQDGTSIVVWRDEARRRGRMEYALRPAGSDRFGEGMPLPRPVVTDDGRTYRLAAGGNRAILVWETGNTGASTRIVAASFRTSGPLAPTAPRPVRPSGACT